MSPRHLFEDEQIITQSDKNIITLTNRRIRYADSQGSKAHFVSILLEKISCIEVNYQSKPFYLLFGLLFALAGFFTTANFDRGEPLFLGGVIAVIFIILFFLSRKHFLVISSDGGSGRG